MTFTLSGNVTTRTWTLDLAEPVQTENRYQSGTWKMIEQVVITETVDHQDSTIEVKAIALGRPVSKTGKRLGYGGQHVFSDDADRVCREAAERIRSQLSHAGAVAACRRGLVG